MMMMMMMMQLDNSSNHLLTLDCSVLVRPPRQRHGAWSSLCAFTVWQCLGIVCVRVVGGCFVEQQASLHKILRFEDIKTLRKRYQEIDDSIRTLEQCEAEVYHEVDCTRIALDDRFHGMENKYGPHGSMQRINLVENQQSIGSVAYSKTA
eukprot:6004109-Amphidinium_carterae.1